MISLQEFQFWVHDFTVTVHTGEVPSQICREEKIGLQNYNCFGYNYKSVNLNLRYVWWKDNMLKPTIMILKEHISTVHSHWLWTVLICSLRKTAGWRRGEMELLAAAGSRRRRVSVARLTENHGKSKLEKIRLTNLFWLTTRQEEHQPYIWMSRQVKLLWCWPGFGSALILYLHDISLLVPK